MPRNLEITEDEDLRNKILTTVYHKYTEVSDKETALVSLIDLAKKWGVSKGKRLSNVKHVVERGLIRVGPGAELFTSITDLGTDFMEGYLRYNKC